MIESISHTYILRKRDRSGIASSELTLAQLGLARELGFVLAGNFLCETKVINSRISYQNCYMS
jgi:hypothetical protein